MADQIVVLIDPARVKVGAGEQVVVSVLVQNRSEDVVYYGLSAEGVAPEWVDLVPDRVSAFPLQEARAELRLHPPATTRGSTYYLTIRAAPQGGSGSDVASILEVEVPGASAMAPAPSISARVVVPRLRSTAEIEVGAEPVVNPNLALGTGQWVVRVKNAGSVIDTFGFNVGGTRLAELTVDPPQLPLIPGQTESATLTARLPDGTPAGPKSLVLRVYSHLNLQEQTEIPLRLEMGGSPSGAPPANPEAIEPPVPARGKSTGPVPLELAADQGRVIASPGAPGRVNVLLQNRGGSPLALDFSGLGVPESWVSVTPGSVTVPARGAVSAIASLSLPANAPAGSFPFSIRAQARQYPAINVRVDVHAEFAGTPREARGPAPIQLAVDRPLVSVAPGTDTEARVTIQNLTTALDTVGVEVSGIDPSWVRVIPTQQTVYPQRQAVVRVVIQPPLDPTAAVAGIYPLTLRGRSQEYAGQEGESALELDVQLVGDYQASLTKTEGRAVREIDFQIQVNNQANAPLRVRFSGSDPAQALAYKLDPLEGTVLPTGELSATLSVRAKQASTDERRIPFTVRVQGEFETRGSGRIAGSSFDLPARLIQVPSPRLTLTVLPAQLEATDGGKFEVRVGNPTDQPVTVRLAASCVPPASGVASPIQLDLLATELTVAAHAEETTSLMARAEVKPTAGQRGEAAIQVTAAPTTDEVLTSTNVVRLVSVGPVAAPSRFPRRALLVIPVIAVIAAAAVGANALIGQPAPALPPAPVLPTSQPPTPVPTTVPVAVGTATPQPQIAVPIVAATPTSAPAISVLQKQVGVILAALPPKATAVFLNLTGSEKVEVDPTSVVTSASTIKLPLMVEVYRQAAAGTVSLDQKLTVAREKIVGGTGVLQNQPGRVLSLRELMEVTLTYSDNTGANMLIDLVGMDQVNSTMQKLGFTHTKLARKLMDTQAQQQGRENVSSAGDLSELLRRINRGELISKDASADMYRILKLRGEQIDSSLDFLGRKLTPRPVIAHVNGVLTGVRNDAGIVVSPTGPYVLAIMLSNQANESAAEDAIATASASIFAAMAKKT